MSGHRPWSELTKHFTPETGSGRGPVRRDSRDTNGASAGASGAAARSRAPARTRPAPPAGQPATATGRDR